MSDLPFPKRYYTLALDPIHVGTGGYHLGRVDMSIVREPGTNLPKIPGTSISGACRTYAAMRHPDRWPHCAGQGQPDGKTGVGGHCGNKDCPICVTFGFVRGNSSFQGLAQFSDARLVLFPVHSLAGPVWVTCPDILLDLGIKEDDIPKPADNQVYAADGLGVGEKLNLGWLMLNAQKDLDLNEKLTKGEAPKEITEFFDRVVLVSNKLFSQIVNDNLEVRTSVSIDPATGAAADGALFTYEALPRGSVLTFDVVTSDPKYYCIGGSVPLGGDGEKVVETVREGLALFETLGVGGMNTRGMGRLRILGLDAAKTAGGAA
jgi:CRISPR-associated protein Cmr4